MSQVVKFEIFITGPFISRFLFWIYLSRSRYTHGTIGPQSAIRQSCLGMHSGIYFKQGVGQFWVVITIFPRLEFFSKVSKAKSVS